jgi:RNA polymerase sigma factor (sigma-70 family)
VRHTGVSVRDAARPPPSDLVSFEAFVATSRPAALRLGHLLTGSIEVGQEVAQDAFLAVHSRWAQIDDPAAYLRVVIVNRSRTVQRRQILERRHAHRQVEGVTHLPEFDTTWHLIRCLPVDQRIVLVLRFYDDLTIADIAATMNKPEGTIKSLLHRGLNRLRTSIT